MNVSCMLCVNCETLSTLMGSYSFLELDIGDTYHKGRPTLFSL